jgi:putative Mg2+ transporter-C (MgtC) family protein
MLELSGPDFLPLFFALLLGGSVGLEREFHGRPAGLRTHILVCLSSTMLIMMSQRLASEGAGPGAAARLVFDPNRMGAGIVTGIGFLGASTVLRSGDFLRGLTTAACIWYVAGLGIVLGDRNYQLGVVCTAIVLVVLTVVNRLGSWITPTVYRRLIVLTQRKSLEPLVAEIRAELRREGIGIMDVASGHDNERGVQELVFYVALKNELQSPRLTERVSALEGVRGARWKLIGSPH